MKRFLVLLCALVLVFSLSACGERKNEDSSQSKSYSPANMIIGTWKDGLSIDHSTITFNSDGTGEMYVKDSGTSVFSWSVDSSNALTITTEAGDNSADKMQYYSQDEYRNLSSSSKETAWSVVEKALYLKGLYYIR